MKINLTKLLELSTKVHEDIRYWDNTANSKSIDINDYTSVERPYSFELTGGEPK